MKKSLAPLLLVSVLASACTDRQAAVPASTANGALAIENVALKEQVAKLEQQVAELRNTPSVMLAAVRTASADISQAETAAKTLEAKFPGSEEAGKANALVAQLKTDQAAREAEAKRVASLGLKALKVSSTLVGDEATISLSSASQTRRWISDAYDSSHHYRDAEKGSAFVVARVKALSENKNPALPGVALYRAEGATLQRVASFSYEFVRWRDYGSYLGNYADYSNDFAHTNVIPLSIGANATLANLERPLFVVGTKDGCHKRSEDRFRHPPVSYYEAGCASLKETLEVGDFSTGRLALLQRLN
jgi:hypothetical protein